MPIDYREICFYKTKYGALSSHAELKRNSNIVAEIFSPSTRVASKALGVCKDELLIASD